MGNNNKSFNQRVFTAIILLFLAIIMPISGTLILARFHTFNPVHGFGGALFIILSIWHICLNRKPLWNYIRNLNKHRNSRTFAAIFLVLFGLMVIISGKILEESHWNQNDTIWLTIHVLLGIFCTIIGGWHIYLNHKPLLNYIKTISLNPLRYNMGTRLAILIIGVLIVLVVVHSRL